jgi:hypothetical protein
MKWSIRGLLVVGSVAVIATTTLPAWELWSNDVSITTVTLDSQTSELHYMVHAELRGPGPFPDLDGWVAARLDVSPSQPTSASTIEIRSITHPDLMPTITPVPGTVTHADAFMDAWLDCTGDPCAEDFEIVITRNASVNPPPLQVSGYVQAYAGSSKGESKEQPQDSEVVVSVTGPL